MCVIYHMSYEFNNWRAFYDVVDFIAERHGRRNYPKIRIEVPQRLRDSGWKNLDGIVSQLKEFEPDDLEEMSIYGVISFEVTKYENLNITV